MNNQQKIEVAWYLKNGAYPAERLIPDKDGLKYVIGDYSWNLKYPENREYVEGLMPIVRFQESARKFFAPQKTNGPAGVQYGRR